MNKRIDRLKDANPYKHIRQKTNDEWLLYWVCEDPEFKQLMVDYFDQFESKTKVVNGKVEINLTHEERNYAENIRQTALTKFGLSENEFDTIQTGGHTQGSFDFPFEYLGYNKDGSVNIKIPHDIKRSDYIAAWPEVLEMVRPEPVSSPFDDEEPTAIKAMRNRAADDTLLIYSIYRARKEGFKFSKIFNLYQHGRLSCYVGMPTNQFTSEDSLERYYNKYKPDR